MRSVHMPKQIIILRLEYSKAELCQQFQILLMFVVDFQKRICLIWTITSSSVPVIFPYMVQKEATVSVFAIAIFCEIEAEFSFIVYVNLPFEPHLKFIMDKSTLNGIICTIQPKGQNLCCSQYRHFYNNKINTSVLYLTLKSRVLGRLYLLFQISVAWVTFMQWWVIVIQSINTIIKVFNLNILSHPAVGLIMSLYIKYQEKIQGTHEIEAKAFSLCFSDLGNYMVGDNFYITFFSNLQAMQLASDSKSIRIEKQLIGSLLIYKRISLQYIIKVFDKLVHKMIGQENRLKKIHALLPQTKKIRNVSIVAHVDHGKTTLADCLIASNGIIHKKQAGQLKLLDDRYDEQQRGITMKSSSICLLHNDCVINLIDSPGHLEFYFEVSAALRLTDSALLVVDVVQGVSSQTFRVLHQLYVQKLPSILVLNKMDKLITHCKMQPMEAYNHLNQIIEQVNAVLGSFITKEVGPKDLTRKKSEDSTDNHIQRLQDRFYFSVEKKNIVFASSIDNWGFSVQNFAELLAKKLGEPTQKILKYMWGDYYYHPKKKQFSEQPRNENDRPLCVDFILKPVWDIFQMVQNQDIQKINMIIQKLKLKVTENAKKNFNYYLIRQILNSWLPLDKLLLTRIVQILPDPTQAQAFRLPYLLRLNSSKDELKPRIIEAISKCSYEQKEPLILFISKMVNIPKKNFNERGLNQLKGQGENRTLGFGRIFSGKFQRGQEVFVIGPRKKRITNENGQTIQVKDIVKVKVENIYLFNAQYPEGVQTAYAGNIVGIGGLQNYIFKSGTISTDEECISFVPIANQTKSILKVSITTPNFQDNHKMLEGLKKLNKSDPSVDVYIEQSGDIVLSTCGEVHLEKCLVDLEEIYCKVPIKASQPIVNFRETIVWSNPLQNKNQKYIEEAERKKQLIIKKQLMQKYKEEMKIDAELDQLEKEKLKAIEDWDAHVEIYGSEDLTTQDTRFFFKNWDEQVEEKYDYKQQKEIKKTDHRNKGKLHLKQKFLNLNMKTNISSQLTPNQFLKITIKALGVEFQFAEYLQKNAERVKKLFGTQHTRKEQDYESLKEQSEQFVNEFKQKMQEYQVNENVRKIILQNIVSFGPNGFGPNILCIPFLDKRYTLFRKFETDVEGNDKQNILELNKEVLALLQQHKCSTNEILNSIIGGFSIACTSGPLCNEPLMGVVFIVEKIQRVGKVEPVKQNANDEKQSKDTKTQKESNEKNLQKVQQKISNKQEQIVQKKEEKAPQSIQNGIKEKTQKLNKPQGEKEQKNEKKFIDSFGPLTGQVMSTVKCACIQAFLGGSPRLVEPVYLCQLQTDQQFYGQIHNQLSKRRAKVVQQYLHEISNIFIIKAHLPIIESFKFCHQILDRTQGTVNAQLNFDTWKVYNEDPFYTPLTQQEIEENGLDYIGHNNARLLLEKIRQKKGLATTEKIVTAAEKQKTLKKK